MSQELSEELPNEEDDLISIVAALERDKKDYWDKYLRAIADLDNTRKRTKREIEDAALDTKQKVLKEVLSVVDNLERALDHAGSEASPLAEGVQLVLRQFQTVLAQLDVTPIEAAGQLFDPRLHEAISQQESGFAPGTVLQVLQRGYRSDDRLLRPALVVVAKARAR